MRERRAAACKARASSSHAWETNNKLKKGKCYDKQRSKDKETYLAYYSV